MSSLVSSKTTEQDVFQMWRKAMGPKAKETSGRILEVSFGLQRMQRFLSDIETKLSVKICPSIAMQLGTIGAIANAIDTDLWPSPSALVLMRDGSDDEVMFIAAAASGIVLELCDLVQLITFKGKIFGLQPPGLAGETEPLRSVGAIADYYKTNILHYAPRAKYHVLGYSFGGLVVLELAKKLRDEGCNLGLVGILDSTCYEKYWPRQEWIRAAAKRIKRQLAEMKKNRSLTDSFSFLVHCTRIAMQYVQRRLKQTDRPTVVENSAYYIGGLDPYFQNVRNANITAFEAYNPPMHDGSFVLFKSEFGDPNACDPVSIWKRKIPNLLLVHVPGTHATMIRKPFAQTLATKISILIDK